MDNKPTIYRPQQTKANPCDAGLLTQFPPAGSRKKPAPEHEHFSTAFLAERGCLSQTQPDEPMAA